MAARPNWMLSVLLLLLAPGAVLGFYARNLNLDFLCNMELTAYVRDVPWDCGSYIICMNGEAIPTPCPHGKLYASAARNSKCEPAINVDASRCFVNMWDYIGTICLKNPTARVPDPRSCGHFYDCTIQNGGADFMDFLVECPYPTLFSKETAMCTDYRLVACWERTEPKAPCEYLQYMQMYDCPGPNCLPCKLRHPSCVGLRNGRQPVPMRNDVMMECNEGRTINILSVSGVSHQRSPAASSSLQAASSSATIRGRP